MKIGDILENNKGLKFIIEDKFSETYLSKNNKRCYKSKFKIRFLETKYTCWCTSSAVKKGEVKDKRQPSVFNVGYLDMEKVNLEDKKIYTLWHNMLSRCYNENSKDYKNYNDKNVTVCKRWHSFKNFLNDIPNIEGYNETLFNEGKLHLDKDKKQNFDLNKVYSLETCIFINPKENYNLIDRTQYRKKFKCYNIYTGEILLVTGIEEFSKKIKSKSSTIKKRIENEDYRPLKGFIFFKEDVTTIEISQKLVKESRVD